ncbi:MAG: ammonium transporter, partial [Pseudomonadota bacterium]
AIPVHLLAGIFGTLVVPLSNGDATFGVQLVGVVAFAIFSVVTSGLIWFILKSSPLGLRVSKEEEALGLDKSEVGVEAYPEFR